MSLKKFAVFGLLMALVLAVSPLFATAAAAADKAPPAQSIQAAKAEGTIVSYGLPNSWVNYGGLMKGFNQAYGIAQKDTDMDSGTIINTLIAEAKVPGGRHHGPGAGLREAGGGKRPLPALHECLLVRDPGLCQGPEGPLVRRHSMASWPFWSTPTRSRTCRKPGMTS